jgi:hypothetical protein
MPFTTSPAPAGLVVSAVRLCAAAHQNRLNGDVRIWKDSARVTLFAFDNTDPLLKV